MRTALYAVRPGGYIVEAGLPTRPVTLPIVTLTLRGLTLIGSVCYSLRCWPEVIDEIVSGRLPAERIVSGHVDLAHAVEDGFERLLDPAQDAVKVLVGVGSA
jgi:(R,R)-butanediol dehydrogenase/meso-butanediol dehydrogenase/diacetyl reductase